MNKALLAQSKCLNNRRNDLASMPQRRPVIIKSEGEGGEEKLGYPEFFC